MKYLGLLRTRYSVVVLRLVHIFVAFALAFPAYAQPLQGFVIPDKPTGIPEGTLPELIAQVIKAALLLVGITALGFIVYGGFRYIISRGDEKEVEQAKKTITFAVIGIIVIGLAYAIVAFVIGAFFETPEQLPPPRSFEDGGR